jgi:hypothetical protein
MGGYAMPTLFKAQNGLEIRQKTLSQKIIRTFV